MANRRKQQPPKHVPVGSFEAGMKIMEQTLRHRYDNIWKPAWREQCSFEQLKAAFKPTDPQKIAQASEEQIRNSVGWGCILKIEFGLNMAPIVACRTGKHPSCIDGQPYDPRYQQPNTLPLTSSSAT